jgi:hypothetical protein
MIQIQGIYEVEIALQVVIARDKVSGPARDGDLEKGVVVRIATQLHRALDRYDRRSGGAGVP